MQVSYEREDQEPQSSIDSLLLTEGEIPPAPLRVT